jgi:carboxylesterase
MRYVNPLILALVGLTVWLSLGLGCQLAKPECDSTCQSDWLDGSHYADSSNDALLGTEYFDSTIRLSTRYPKPDSSLLALPVIICLHGFSATTFEWKEFADTVTKNNFKLTGKGPLPAADSILVSRVLLGGHGGDYTDFEASTWLDWQAPILAEYDSLVAKGYRNISFAAASAAAPLLLEAFASGFFDKQHPREVFFIDPIIVASNKFLTLAPIIGSFIGNVEDIGTTEEQKHWYSNRPAKQLNELYTLINRVKNRLESGQTLPTGVRLKVYKSRHDASADPVGALYLKKGLRHADGSGIEVEMIDSRLHVFTRLAGRSHVDAADSSQQSTTFADMVDRIRKHGP